MLNLDEIKKRAEAATPGPWEPSISATGTVAEAADYAAKVIAAGDGSAVYGVWCPDHPGTVIGGDRTHPAHAVQACLTGNGPNSEHNAEFIAHARTDVPALVAEVERLRALNSRLVAALEKQVVTTTDKGERCWCEDVSCLHVTRDGSPVARHPDCAAADAVMLEALR